MVVASEWPNCEAFWCVEFKVIKRRSWLFVSLAYEHLQPFRWFMVVKREATLLVDTTEL